MNLKRLIDDKYLWILIVIAVIFTAYWINYGIHKYETYNAGYYDIGIYVYSLYWHIHYAQSVGPLLYLSTFENHVSPFLFIILSIFYFYQNPIVLYFIQDIFLALTAILVYFVTADITKRRGFSLALATAFLLNPGITGLTIFDSHIEAFIPFFYILIFYCYLKNKKVLFVVGLLFLLSIMETTFPLALTLFVALLIYELIYARKQESKEEFKSKMALLGAGFIITILFAGFYIAITSKAIEILSITPYSVVPPITRTLNYISIASTKATNVNIVGAPIIAYLGILGIIFLFIGFGISSFVNPLITLILISTWLFEAFVLHDFLFVSQNSQYYANFVGASYVAAILGYLMLSKNKQKLFGIIKIDPEKSVLFNPLFIIIIVVMMFPIYSGIGILTLPSSNQPINYTQINNAIHLIPINSTVMAQISIAPHLYYIKNLELAPSDNPIKIWSTNLTVTWFEPQYIVVDPKLNGYSELVNSTEFNLYKYMGNNYTVYYNQSGLYIFKRIG